MSDKNIPLNILIIGTGMYVCGKGTNGFGTILPAIYEWKRSNILGDIYIAGTNTEGLNIVKDKIEALNRLFGYNIHPRYFPESGISNEKAYKDAIRQLPEPACAIVVVPDNLHREIAGDVIEKSIHILVVKPLAPTVSEVQELIDLQRRRKVYGVVEFHKRLDRSNLKLKDSIESGIIGEPLYFVIEYSQRKSIPLEKFKKWVETTNIFQYLGIHYLDIIYFATKAIPLRVMAIGQKGYLYSKGVDTYDSIQAVIEWKMKSGKTFISSFFTNWIDPENTSAMSDQKIKVIGTNGRFEADQKNRGIYLVTDENGVEEPNPDFCSVYGIKSDSVSYQGYGIDSVMQFLKDVLVIEFGEAKPEDFEGKRPTFSDAIVPTQIIEAANKSLAENGRWITITIN